MIKSVLSDLARFKSVLEKKGYSVQRMVLFGSHARGDALKQSDVDVILVSSDFSDLSVPRRRMLLEEAWPSRRALETLPYTPEEFERVKKTSYTVRDALRYGIVI